MRAIGARRIWDQSLALAGAGLRARMRGTLLGAVWVFALPLATVAVQLYFFGHVLRFDLPQYPVYLLSGLLPWIWALQSFEMGIATLHGQAPCFRAAPLHPASVLVGSFLGSSFAAGVPLVGLALATSGSVAEAALRIALLLPAAAVFSGCVLSALLVLAVLQVRMRDTRFLMSFGMSLLYFASPIFYPESAWPESARGLLSLNPVYAWIAPIRAALYEPLRDGYVRALLIALALAFLQALVARALWRKGRKAVYASA